MPQNDLPDANTPLWRARSLEQTTHQSARLMISALCLAHQCDVCVYQQMCLTETGDSAGSERYQQAAA